VGSIHNLLINTSGANGAAFTLWRCKLIEEVLAREESFNQTAVESCFVLDIEE
jgi:hypothetical protein